MATSKKKPSIIELSDEDEDLKFVRPRVSIKMINGASPYFGTDQSVITRIGNVIIGGDYSGDTRGEYTIDFQILRTAVTQVASGLNSIAIGNQLTASGWNAICFGFQSQATAESSVALGVASIASGKHSLAIGDQANAVNDYGVSLGYLAHAQGVGISVGSGTESGNDGVAIGDNAIAAVRSVSIGASTNAGTDEVVFRGLHLFLQTDAAGTRLELPQGTGVNTRVAYWSGTSALTSSANLTFDGNKLTINSATTGAALSVTNQVMSAVDVGAMTFTARSYASSNSIVGFGGAAVLDSFSAAVSTIYLTGGQVQIGFSFWAGHNITVTTAQGLYVQSPSGGGGAPTINVSNLYGLRVDAQAVAGLTITNVYYAYLAGDSAAVGTNKYGLYLGGISGASTLNYAIYTNAGLVHFGDSLDLASGKSITLIAGNIATDTTTGTKIGTATNQKIGFYNAAPIIQPTTAGAASAFTANAGTGVNDASTFDGYTLKQVVKALRNLGLLA